MTSVRAWSAPDPHRLLAIAASLALAGCTVVSRIPLPDGGPDSGTRDAFVPDAGVDTGSPPCPSGEILCSGECTRVAADPRHCGSCGNACPSGVGCAAGRCDCSAPRIACAGVCLDPSSEPANCGACGNVCEPTEMCSEGACVVMCTSPQVVCVIRDPSGETEQVCVSLQTDASHCGRCNTRCAGGAVCSEGRCQCPVGRVNCGGTCVDTTSDADNCGSCRASCGTGGTCAGGRCATCGTGLTDCGGRCLDLTSDRFNCGSCARTCGTAEACAGGLCECTGTLIDCGTGCLDTSTHVAHCGGCGIACGAGGVCSDGTCTCPAGLSLCSTGCRNLATDLAHCGACDAACTLGGGACTGGVCACPSGMTDCDGTCRNLATDLGHCGACDAACTLGGGTCTGGVCACPSGMTDCDGTCRDLGRDRDHCGACDAACPDGEICVASGCTDVPPPDNDTCAGAIALTGASGTRTGDTLIGAARDSDGDCGGEEVYYSITITQRSLLYLDTFGTTFDTSIAHRGTACTGTATTCADDACSLPQSQITVLANAGTHFFSVHAGPAASAGPFSLRWQAVPAAAGSNTRIMAAGTFTGSTSGASALDATCTDASGPENSYWFTLCPGTTRSVRASTCGSSFDTVLHVLGRSGSVACNDDTDCGGFFDLESALTFGASGPGLWEILVDGFSGARGPYTLSVTGL